MIGAQKARTLVKNQWRTKTILTFFLVRTHDCRRNAIVIAVAPKGCAPAEEDRYSRGTDKCDKRCGQRLLKIPLNARAGWHVAHTKESQAQRVVANTQQKNIKGKKRKKAAKGTRNGWALFVPCRRRLARPSWSWCLASRARSERLLTAAGHP